MKRVALLSIIFTLVVSLAAPTGAAFASDDLTDNASTAEAAREEVVAEEPVTSDAIGPIDALPTITTTLIGEASVTQLELSNESIVLDDSPTPPVIVTPPVAPIVPEPVTTPPLIITTFDVSDGLEFVELYNQSGAPIDVSTVRLQGSAGGESCSTTIANQGFILPGEFFYARSPSYLPGHFDRTFANECLIVNAMTRLELFISGSRVQLVDGIQLAAGKWGAHGGAWSTKGERKDFTSLKQAGNFTNHYILVAANPNYVYTSNAYVPLDSTGGLDIIEILPNSRSCAPGDTGYDCEDYVKVHNNSDTDINLAPFRLRIGSRTANATTTTSFNWHEPTLHPERDELMLPAGEYFTVKLRNDSVALALSNAESNVWLEDYFGVTAYQIVSYEKMDLAAARGMSWAYDQVNNLWQFGIPSPYGANRLYVPKDIPESGKGSAEEGMAPCGPGQYRSEETKRCRNIVTASSLIPCREGQYRSEETNRCRSIATAAASVLKPCADDQFRNPETNRCKKIASSEDIALADCGEGRERNPATNRCRNAAVAGSFTDTMPFPVEPVEAGVEQFVGWWTIGILAALGASYGAWEWREELLAAGRKAGRFITRSK